MNNEFVTGHVKSLILKLSNWNSHISPELGIKRSSCWQMDEASCLSQNVLHNRLIKLRREAKSLALFKKHKNFLLKRI